MVKQIKSRAGPSDPDSVREPTGNRGPVRNLSCTRRKHQTAEVLGMVAIRNVTMKLIPAKLAKEAKVRSAPTQSAIGARLKEMGIGPQDRRRWAKEALAQGRVIITLHRGKQMFAGRMDAHVPAHLALAAFFLKVEELLPSPPSPPSRDNAKL